MAKVQVNNVVVLDNPSPFYNPFQFEITFECIEDLSEGERASGRGEAVSGGGRRAKFPGPGLARAGGRRAGGRRSRRADEPTAAGAPRSGGKLEVAGRRWPGEARAVRALGRPRGSSCSRGTCASGRGSHVVSFVWAGRAGDPPLRPRGADRPRAPAGRPGMRAREEPEWSPPDRLRAGAIFPEGGRAGPATPASRRPPLGG